jgi:type IV pilus assembly protein PilP
MMRSSRSLGVLVVSLAVLLPAVPMWAQEQGLPQVAAEDGESPPYNPVGRRDPFRPFMFDLRKREPENVELTPLQRYDLGQLTVVGTMWEMNPPRAMVEDSAGMGFIVTIGTPIGRNGGVVAAIEPRRVIVEEKTVDFYGNEQVNRIVMETPSDEGPSQPGREKK